MQFVPIAPMASVVTVAPDSGMTTGLVVSLTSPSTDPNNNPPARGKKTQRPDNKTRGKGDALRPQKQGKNVGRRNERERNRVKQVNLGFERLRQHVPNGGKNKKLSKVDTLKSAVDYIAYLQDVLDSPLGTPPPYPQSDREEDMENDMDSFVESLVGESSPQGYYPEERPSPQGYPALEPLLSPADPHPSESLPSPGGYHTAPSLPSSLPSPGGYSTDGSVGSEHYSEPLSPEDRQLLQFASWLTGQNS